MSNNIRKPLKILLLIGVSLLLISSTTVTPAVNAGEMTQNIEASRESQQHFYDMDDIEIGIFYDENNKISNTTGHAFNRSIGKMTPDVNLYEIDNLNNIHNNLLEKDLEIALYTFQSNYDQLIISGKDSSNLTYSWNEVVETIQQHKDTEQIFAMGNTKQLLATANNASYIHGSYEEKVDAKHQFIYGMWTVAKVLEKEYETTTTKNLANDIKKVTAKYLSNNFNDIVARNLKQVNALGVEHPATIKQRKENFKEKHPAKVKRLSRDGYVADQETMREVDPATGQVIDDYVMDIIPQDSITPGDFILQKLPLTSGLRGPIGGIVDKLLGFLINQFSAVIGLSQKTVEGIVNILMQIPDLIGDLENKAGSALKTFLDNLKNQLPIPQDMMKYYNLIVEGLFLLRGEFEDIKNFIFESIQLMVPDISIGGVSLTDLLSQLLTLGNDVKNTIENGGKDLISVVFQSLNQLISSNLTSTLLNNITSVISASSGEIYDLTQQIMGILNVTINLISSGDVVGLIDTFGPLLMQALGVPTEVVSPVMKIISIVLTGLEYVKGTTIKQLLADLLDEFLSEDQQKIAGKLLSLITDIIEGEIAGSDARSEVDDILSEFNVDSKIRKAISFVVLLVVKIRNKNFNLASLAPDVNIASMINALVDGIGGVATQTKETIISTMQFVIGQIKYYKNLPIIDTLVNSTIAGINNLKDLMYRTVEHFLKNVLDINQDFEDAYPTADKIVTSALTALSMIIQSMGTIGENSLQGLMMTLLNGASFIITQVSDVDIRAYTELAKAIIGDAFDLVEDPPSLTELIDIIKPYIPSSIKDKITTVIEFIFDIKDVFTNGFEFVFSKLVEWISGKAKELISSLTGDITNVLSKENWNLLDIDLPVGIGSFSLFSIDIKLGLKPNFEFDFDKFSQMLFDLILRGKDLFDDALNFKEILNKALSFISIVPTLTAEMELSGFGSDSNAFLTFMLEALGVQLSVSGSGNFALSLFSFTNGVFNTESFMKIIEWGFTFTVELSRTFTLLDFLTGGAAGGLSSIAKYIGLDAVTLTIALALTIELIKRAATANMPETGSLTITVEISFTVAIALDLAIAALKLAGTLAITLTLLQDLVNPQPMRVFIAIQLIIEVTIEFLGANVDIEVKWSPSGYEPDPGYELTPSSQKEATENGALGGDFDGDGLGNAYERDTPGLNPKTNDSDGDTLSDKYESQTLGTDPGKRDTDGDGLADNVELNLKTDPLNPDSDYDGINDYNETNIYGTDPLAQDTDEDGLTDKYEINHEYNISTVTTTVKEVEIGGVIYDDRTDPLNPDTDADGLLDGQEGPTGTYYGPNLANNSEDVEYEPDDPLIYNNGYTHPLDNDTDDDSRLQLYDGSVPDMEDNYLMDMTDGREVKGIEVVYIDPETGVELPPNITRTNPVNPDSDGDTGIDPEDRDNPPLGEYINSDGYELSVDPPTDPLDGDSDNDGLMDGLEGTLKSDSNHTNPNNPDTDGDGLADMLEVQLGTDPRSTDTDLDGVSDGDEYFEFGTSPFMADTDGDGVDDGDELFLYHSNPFIQDSDKDGLDDYQEVYQTFSDPVDDDSDNDGLTDFEEVMVYYTDPFKPDTDGDGLFDGEEVEGITLTSANGTDYTVRTDPTKWDTDGDSITHPDKNGDMSMPMSDGDEVLKYGTNPTRGDTDSDNIKDGWELWLGKGQIPHIDAMPLDPVNNDTDGDGLTDGKELTIANRSTLLYPYVGFYMIEPRNSSAVKFDTDGDGLNDSLEVQINSNPRNNDTDGDGLSDADEYMNLSTSPIKNDTDGDGLTDWEEINGISFGTNSTFSTQEIIRTDPLDPDTDDDLLPDGREVNFYTLDPRIQDEDNNGIIDGMQIDTDGDGLYDGEEYFIYETATSPYGGGPQDPDSDGDGLFDGFEVYETNTSPSNPDTDNDTYGDGLEYQCGTDPLSPTNSSEIEKCFAASTSGVSVISPTNTTYSSTNIPVVAYDQSGSVTDMEYRYRRADSSGNWSISHDLTKDTNSSYWRDDSFSIPEENNTWVMEITAQKNNSTTTQEIIFTIDLGKSSINILKPLSDSHYNFTDTTPKIEVEVNADLSINKTYYSVDFGNGTNYIANESLSYNTDRRTFVDKNVTLPEIEDTTDYTLTVYGQDVSGAIVSQQIQFTITYDEGLGTVEYVLIGTGVAATLGGSAFIIRRRMISE